MTSATAPTDRATYLAQRAQQRRDTDKTRRTQQAQKRANKK